MILFVSVDGWTTDDLQYLWKSTDPVQIVPDLHLPRFTLEKYISDYCNIITNTGMYLRYIKYIIFHAHDHVSYRRIQLLDGGLDIQA